MEEGIEEKRLQEKRERLDAMMRFVRPGLVCEMGCGSGFVLEFLSEHLPGSTLVGVDRSMERLHTAASRSLSDTHYVASEIPGRVFAPQKFDTVIFVWSMHEVYSGIGDLGVLDCLRSVSEMLKDDGVLILQDFLRPAPRQVTLGFNEDHIRDKFLRFAREFRQRDVLYEDMGGKVRLDVGDAVEFISKYRIDDDEEWRHEMDETHFFYTLDQHNARAREAGLSVEYAEAFPLSWEALDAAKDDMEIDFAEDYPWLQLVLRKPM